MDKNFEADPLYGLDKALKSKLIILGLSSVDSVRSAVESGELQDIAGIGRRTIRYIKYWLELIELRKANATSDNIDLVLFGLSSRTRLCLRSENLCSIDAILDAYKNKAFTRVPNIGKASVKEIGLWLTSKGCTV